MLIRIAAPSFDAVGCAWLALIYFCLSVWHAFASQDRCFDHAFQNYGVAGGTGSASERPYDRTGRSHVSDHAICKFAWRDLDQEPYAAINWYSDTTAWEFYHGIDMLPKRHFEYFPGNGTTYVGFERLKTWELGKHGPPHKPDPFHVGDCSNPERQGGAWVFQRVGPFYSNGNLDWWQMQWRDAWRLSNVLKKHPHGVYFSTSLVRPVSDSGELLGYPPFHAHHAHVNLQPGSPFKTCKATNSSMLGLSVLTMAEAGDFVCLPEDGGVDCLFQKPALDDVWEYDRTVDMDCEINDARAPGSETMKWWVQTAIRWYPKSIGEVEPESKITIFPALVSLRNVPRPADVNPQCWTNHPSEDDPFGTLGKSLQVPKGKLGEIHEAVSSTFDAQNFIGTMDLNTSEHSIKWGSVRSVNGGELIRIKPHTHSGMSDRSFWFRATPQDLGLVGGEHTFPFHNFLEYTLLSETGLKKFDDVQSYLMENLAATAHRFDSHCQQSSSPATGCAFNKPFMICKFVTSMADAYDPKFKQSFAYDRFTKSCCNHWTFKPEQVYTMVGFFPPLSRPPGPWALIIPPIFPQHMVYFMDYKLKNSQSDGKHSVRKDHSYFSSSIFIAPNSSLGYFVAGDTWELMLRSASPILDDWGLPTSIVIQIMKGFFWPDGLYDGPNDYPKLLEHGVYLHHAIVDRDTFSLHVLGEVALQQIAMLQVAALFMWGMVLMSIVCKGCNLKWVRQIMCEGRIGSGGLFLENFRINHVQINNYNAVEHLRAPFLE